MDRSFLIHYGISGQKWGVRRFQNEDGTLTEEGKARYYDNLTDRQKSLYDRMSPKNQQRIEQKMGEGKSFYVAQKEVSDASKRKANLVSAAVLAGSYGLLLTYLFPSLRGALKSALRQGVSKIVNSKAVGGTLLKARKVIEHLKMRKAGAIIVKAKDAWISGDRLGA